MQIMVVDDDVEVMKITVSTCQLLFHDVTKAYSAEECLKVLNGGYFPDIIILDIMMPGMNGFELCRTLKKHEKYRSIPIVFLSAKSQTKDIEYAYSSGADGYVTKPFDPYELIKYVEAVEKATRRKH